MNSEKDNARVKQYLVSQFSHPRGIAGWLVGQLMAYENRERISWTIEQLDIQPDDFVLEIGIGPGLGIEQAAAKAINGFAAGIDVSETMIQQASRRNALSIGEGRVELRQSDVVALPYGQHTFDKVFAINSLHHWSDPNEGLKDCSRILKPGGLLAIMEQPHGVQSVADIQQRGRELVAWLAAAGIREAAFTCVQLKRGPAVLAKGTRPSRR